MWEADELGSEDLLWAAMAFTGGIGGDQRAPCGVVSASTVYLGLHHRCSSDDKEKVEKARDASRVDASKVVKSFCDEFGTIICKDLLGIDFTKPEEARYFRESGLWKEKCDRYIQFVIDKLYELEGKR